MKSLFVSKNDIFVPRKYFMHTRVILRDNGYKKRMSKKIRNDENDEEK